MKDTPAIMSPYQSFIHMTRYSRWMPEKKRRETWDETVARYIDFFCEERGSRHPSVVEALRGELHSAILRQEVMPSMRALMTAGEALRRENVAGFNCSYIAANNKRAFSEALYILMCGTGVGFSCEAHEVAHLPVVPAIAKSNDLIVVEDSKEGWAKAYAKLITCLFQGDIPGVDYSKVRPAGAKLRTFGGRASGPAPLKRLFEFTTQQFTRAQGRKLTSMEVHDIMCMVGEIVVVGGVRRSALISLSDLSDNNLRKAKSNFAVDQYSLVNETDDEWVYTITMKRNQPVDPTYRIVLRKADQEWARNQLEMTKTIPWFIVEPQRGLANNSVAYDERPEAEVFAEEWLSLIKSKSGERGIFNRDAAQRQAARYGRRSSSHRYGTNPCSEIILRDKQFCNLTEVVIRAGDTKETIRDKVRRAVILGTLQASLTKFGFLSEKWRQNTEEEALLGVSLTGIMDNRFTAGLEDRDELRAFLDEMRVYAVEVNKEWAAKIGVKPAAAITCVKPSGTVSQLCDTASGIHARHNTHYVRAVRIDKKDPVYSMFLALGVPMEDDVTRPDSQAVVSFAQRSPVGAVTRNDMTAIEQLETWLIYQRHWCEHKPSVTISVADDEWMDVGAWVFKHFDEVSGISFLPRSDHTYRQAPYQDMTEESLAAWEAANPMPEIDWGMLSQFESDDETVGVQQLACVAGVCEI